MSVYYVSLACLSLQEPPHSSPAAPHNGPSQPEDILEQMSEEQLLKYAETLQPGEPGTSKATDNNVNALLMRKCKQLTCN